MWTPGGGNQRRMTKGGHERLSSSRGCCTTPGFPTSGTTDKSGVLEWRATASWLKICTQVCTQALDMRAGNQVQLDLHSSHDRT